MCLSAKRKVPSRSGDKTSNLKMKAWHDLDQIYFWKFHPLHANLNHFQVLYTAKFYINLIVNAWSWWCHGVWEVFTNLLYTRIASDHTKHRSRSIMSDRETRSFTMKSEQLIAFYLPKNNSGQYWVGIYILIVIKEKCPPNPLNPDTDQQQQWLHSMLTPFKGQSAFIDNCLQQQSECHDFHR